MKKILMIISAMLVALSATAADCADKSFTIIRDKAKQMEQAWDAADLDKVVSFYDDDFMYMSGGKTYTSKDAVLKHYLDGFAANKAGKRDMGKLKLNYEYCRNLDENHQLVILKFIWDGSDGKVVTGHDLLVWQKDGKDNYTIIVDFPQS
ncbi:MULTISPECIES: nuclear transport factor 2 family protein [Francisella]|uniref:DUF4440 domain-containing protein n=1 Tax=Francisella salina TaxID=573569 RepID=A0ABN3ZJ96_FRAST|nr:MULTISPECIES: nuclear transport factor 2 family protein [Francisella]AEI35212.1 hypothetical protein F7308_0284 [Francisella salina]